MVRLLLVVYLVRDTSLVDCKRLSQGALCNGHCTNYILRPKAELLSKKNPDISNAKRPRLTAILSTKALTAIPSEFWPTPAWPLRKSKSVSLWVELLLLLAMIIVVCCQSGAARQMSESRVVMMDIQSICAAQLVRWMLRKKRYCH